jgi:hypothetical protein
VPVYPAGSTVNDGPPPEDGGAPKTKPASLKEIWALEGAGPDQPNVLWAGTIPGGLFRSRDCGDSWELVESLWNDPKRSQWFGGGKDEPGIHSICVDPRDSRCVTLGVSCGGVWHSADNGSTWQPRGKGLRAEYMPPNLQEEDAIQDPHLITQCRSAPDTIWMQHHNGIFRTHNRATQWQEITGQPSSFGFAVAVHPNDPKTAWFVPAKKDQYRYPVDGKVVVSRTRDDGQSFEVLANGLPQENAYDIFYRHALAIDDSGETLAMGSTTGGLWISEDSGDHWECLSHTLPPIYVVRFG